MAETKSITAAVKAAKKKLSDRRAKNRKSSGCCDIAFEGSDKLYVNIEEAENGYMLGFSGEKIIADTPEQLGEAVTALFKD